MDKKIAVLAGDGIGPEVMHQALRVLKHVADKFGHRFIFTEALIGGAAYQVYGKHCPEDTLAVCRASDAILFGSVGGPQSEITHDKWRDCERESILSLRKAFQFNANFRPAKVYSQLKEASPLRQEIISNGVDLLIIRELLGDVYFGEHLTFIKDGRRHASDLAEYNEEQISQVARAAFDAAKRRRGKVTSVDKANVLATSRLWREVVNEVSAGYPEIVIEHMLVDNCAMQIIKNPANFDVIVTSNLFGDILSDAAAVLPGSLGLTPSASLNKDGYALYEPSGGSAPDIAGQGIANPIAQILSGAMMLRYSFGLINESASIEYAVDKVLDNGYRTKDIYSDNSILLDTNEFTNKIIDSLD